MEKPIRHVHVRRFAAPLPSVVTAIDALWSGTEQDALPRQLGGWRRSPAGKTGMAEGTRFGHGPFSFLVEQWDGAALRARIETVGFRGQHGFTLRLEGTDVSVTHDLDAQLTPLRWLLWRLFIADGHDWAVEQMFDGMRVLLGEQLASQPRPRAAPLGLRVFVAARRAWSSNSVLSTCRGMNITCRSAPKVRHAHSVRTSPSPFSWLQSLVRSMR